MPEGLTEAEVFAPDGALPQPWTYERPYSQWFQVATPAAGVQPTIRVVPGNTWERIRLIYCQLATSAAVANRVPIIQYFQQLSTPNFFAEIQAQQNIVAAQTTRLTWAIGLAPQSAALGNVMHTDLPDIILQPGNGVVIGCNAIDAADQFSKISFLVDRWQTGPLHDPGPTEEELRILATTYRIIQEGRNGNA